MNRRKEDGAATLVAVAVVAFFVGRCSVDLSTPPAPIASPRLLAAPAADVGPVYYANCSEARAAGAAPSPSSAAQVAGVDLWDGRHLARQACAQGLTGWLIDHCR